MRPLWCGHGCGSVHSRLQLQRKVFDGRVDYRINSDCYLPLVHFFFGGGAGGDGGGITAPKDHAAQAGCTHAAAHAVALDILFG